MLTGLKRTRSMTVTFAEGSTAVPTLRTHEARLRGEGDGLRAGFGTESNVHRNIAESRFPSLLLVVPVPKIQPHSTFTTVVIPNCKQTDWS